MTIWQDVENFEIVFMEVMSLPLITKLVKPNFIVSKARSIFLLITNQLSQKRKRHTATNWALLEPFSSKPGEILT